MLLLSKKHEMYIEAVLMQLHGGKIFLNAEKTIEIAIDGKVLKFDNLDQHDLTQIYRYTQIVIDEVLNPFGIRGGYNLNVTLMVQKFLKEKIRLDLQGKVRVCFVQNGEGGVAFWRATSVSRFLNNKFGDHYYCESTVFVDYDNLVTFDVIIVQRGLFGLEDIYGVLHSALYRLKEAGKIIIYDIDDDLENLSTQGLNPARYANVPAFQILTNWLKENSTLIFTSTEYLKLRIGYPHKTVVLPNSFPINEFQIAQVNPNKDHMLVLFHGAAGHEIDLDWINESLTGLILNRRKNLENRIGKKIIFAFLGVWFKYLEQFAYKEFPIKDTRNLPEYVGRVIDPVLKKAIPVLSIKTDEIQYIKGTKIDQFHDFLFYLNPDIGFCPLSPKHEFNKSKSNIKYIENTLAGAASVVSDLPPFAGIPDDCAIKTVSPKQFVQGIVDLIIDSDRRIEMHAKALEYVKNNFDLERNVDQWQKSIQTILTKPEQN